LKILILNSVMLYKICCVQKIDTVNILQKTENQLITIALAMHNGHREKTAEFLGISKRSLKRKITMRKKVDQYLEGEEK